MWHINNESGKTTSESEINALRSVCVCVRACVRACVCIVHKTWLTIGSYISLVGANQIAKYLKPAPLKIATSTNTLSITTIISPVSEIVPCADSNLMQVNGSMVHYM